MGNPPGRHYGLKQLHEPAKPAPVHSCRARRSHPRLAVDRDRGANSKPERQSGTRQREEKMRFETVSLLLNWLELGALLAILARLGRTFELIAGTQRELRRAIHHLG